jgi:hypothetical protein
VYSNALQHKEIDYSKIIFAVFLMGILWGLTRIAFGLYIIYKLKGLSITEKLDANTVYFNQEIESPFSFFSYIFIPLGLRANENLLTILKHEEAHIQLKHSYDKLFLSLMQSLYWFNPFMYLYHKEIELQHEFEADALSVKQIETDHYVQNLLNTIAQYQTPTLLVHQFFHHPLKTRITMLYKQSKNLFMQKTILIGCGTLLLSVTLLLQGRAQNQQKQDHNPKTVTMMNPNNPDQSMAVTLSKTPDSLHDAKTVDVLPQFQGGEEAMTNYINKTKGTFSDDEKPNKALEVQLLISSTGRVASVGADPFVDEIIQKDIARVFKNMPLWKPATKGGKAVPCLIYTKITY